MEEDKQEQQPKIKPLTKKQKEEIKRYYGILGKWLHDQSLILEKPCYMLIKKDEDGTFTFLGISSSMNCLAILETTKKSDTNYIS